MKQIAGIYFSIKDLDNAEAWQKKVLAEDPKDPEAAYTIGVIDWTKAHQNKLNALQAAGLNDDGKGNVKAPKKVMEPLAKENAPLVEEGLKYLTMAVDNRPNYDDAMQYLNLIYRNKADVDGQPERAGLLGLGNAGTIDLYPEKCVGLLSMVLAVFVKDILTLDLIGSEIQITIGGQRQCVRPEDTRVGD